VVNFRFPNQDLEVEVPEELSAVQDGRWLVVTVPEAGSIRETLQQAGIELGRPAAAVVNGQASDLDRALRDGDCVEMLPQIAGG
jgi:molybdopterin converting factor small subunit